MEEVEFLDARGEDQHDMSKYLHAHTQRPVVKMLRLSVAKNIMLFRNKNVRLRGESYIFVSKKCKILGYI